MIVAIRIQRLLKEFSNKQYLIQASKRASTDIKTRSGFLSAKPSTTIGSNQDRCPHH